MELLIDIDRKTLREFRERFEFVQKYLRFKLKAYQIAKTRRGFHIRLEVEFPFEATDKDIVLIQSLLGDDWRRATINYFRVLNNLDDWNVLFKKKYRMKGKAFKLASEEYLLEEGVFK